MCGGHMQSAAIKLLKTDFSGKKARKEYLALGN